MAVRRGRGRGRKLIVIRNVHREPDAPYVDYNELTEECKAALRDYIMPIEFTDLSDEAKAAIIDSIPRISEGEGIEIISDIFGVEDEEEPTDEEDEG